MSELKKFKQVRKKNIEGINNLTPSYNKLIVSFLVWIISKFLVMKIFDTIFNDKASKIIISFFFGGKKVYLAFNKTLIL